MVFNGVTLSRKVSVALLLTSIGNACYRSSIYQEGIKIA